MISIILSSINDDVVNNGNPTFSTTSIEVGTSNVVDDVVNAAVDVKDALGERGEDFLVGTSPVLRLRPDESNARRLGSTLLLLEPTSIDSLLPLVPAVLNRRALEPIVPPLPLLLLINNAAAACSTSSVVNTSTLTESNRLCDLTRLAKVFSFMLFAKR